MTHAERIVKILLEDGPDIRGEYWIIDGDVTFADGDVGDMNHEAYAVDHARRITLEELGGDSDNEVITDEELAKAAHAALTETGVPFNPDDWYPAVKQLFSAQPNAEALIAGLQTALGMGDAREVAMKYWGWKWCRRSNIATWTFTASDRQQIVRGLNEIVSQEMDADEEGWDTLEITIGVGATGKRYSMTLAELESGRNPSQDPTWGLRENDEMMGYMEPEIERITTRRKLRVGEEVSNGTYNDIDLTRRALKKLEELDYMRYQRFVAENKDYVDTLKDVIAFHARGEDYNKDSVVYHEMIETLWESLQAIFNDEFCMFGTLFGANDGSGSCFGCWPAVDYLREACEEGTEVIEVETVGDNFPPKTMPAQGRYKWMTSPSGHQAMYEPDGKLLWKY